MKGLTPVITKPGAYNNAFKDFRLSSIQRDHRILMWVYVEEDECWVAINCHTKM